MEKLEVRAFGPIKDVSLDIKDVNILIGPSSTGKSVLAKLCLIFKDYEQIKKINTIQSVKQLFGRYGMDGLLSPQTYIRYESENHTITINKSNVKNMRVKNEALKSYNALVRNIDTLEESYLEDVIDLLNNSIFANVKTLIGPFLKRINSLSYALYYQLVSISHLSGELAHKVFVFNNKEWLKTLHGTAIDDDKDYDEEDFLNELYDGADKLLKQCISFSKATIPQLKSIQRSLYVPAERILFSLISEKYFTLESSNASLPKTLLDFGIIVENARKANQVYRIDFMQLAYQFRDNQNIISHNGVRLSLANSASGIQALVPLYLAIEYTNSNASYKNNHFIIEEPELNLYPSQQKSLVEYLVASCCGNNNGITITTHSPYILTTINNLIQADNAYRINPAKEQFINDIIGKKYWLSYDKVAAYYINEGYAENILDKEMRSIGAIHIDDVSEQIGKDFNDLTDIIYS